MSQVAITGEAGPAAAERSAAVAFWALLARLVVGGLFVVTGVAKLQSLSKFAEEIQNYELAPIWATPLMAVTLPWLEVVAGGLLVLTVWRREARWTVATLLVVFTVAKAVLYASGFPGSCGCGGGFVVLETLLENPQGIFVNLGLLGLLVFDGWAQRRNAGGV